MPLSANDKRTIHILFIATFALVGLFVPYLVTLTCWPVNIVGQGACDALHGSRDLIANTINPHPKAFEPAGLAIMTFYILAFISGALFAAIGATVWYLGKRRSS
ncbi:hypothetical protein C4568_04620 [Candidatus Parcubacteria bacterium]|nr:MAG: hypothetical protein C4568_04620 [Candidatus Parcubacteria bacterium]